METYNMETIQDGDIQFFKQAAKFCQEKLNLKETHEILVSVFDVNSFQENIENLLVIIKKNGLKVNVGRNRICVCIL